MSKQNTFSPKYTENKMLIKEEPLPKGSKIIIAGAGAFGGWSAVFLKQAGYDVTLLDPWGAGNSRSSSGGETRLIRCVYGDNELYTQMAIRSFELWKEYEDKFGLQVLYDLPTWWFCTSTGNELLDNTFPVLNKYGLPYERVSVKNFRLQYPDIFTGDLDHVLVEKLSGYLNARMATMAVKDYFVKIGGHYIQTGFDQSNVQNLDLGRVMLTNGDVLETDLLIVASGPWLPKIFPDLKSTLKVTKQEVFYFGVPADFHNEYSNWVDRSQGEFFYGLPQGSDRGFKIALDRNGKEFDPSIEDRTLDIATFKECQEFLGHRFPILKDAPLVEHRVCQYSRTADGNFIFDKYPGMDNCWVLGGGSGHGFKHGPALGEFVTSVVSGQSPNQDLFLFNRFS